MLDRVVLHGCNPCLIYTQVKIAFIELEFRNGNTSVAVIVVIVVVIVIVINVRRKELSVRSK